MLNFLFKQKFKQNKIFHLFRKRFNFFFENKRKKTALDSLYKAQRFHILRICCTFKMKGSILKYFNVNFAFHGKAFRHSFIYLYKMKGN